MNERKMNKTMKNKLSKIGATSLAAVMAFGGPAVSVLASPDVTDDTTMGKEANGFQPLANLLGAEDGFTTDGVDKKEQLIPVHFVTVGDETAGGVFKASSKGELSVSEGVKDAVLQKGIRQTPDGDVRNVAVWTFYYNKDAKGLGTLPSIMVAEGDTFNGFVDSNADKVTEETVPADGEIYYAGYTSNLTYEELDFIKELIDRQDTTTSVTWKLDKTMGQLAEVTGDDVVSAVLSKEKDNLVTEYKLSADKIVVPEVTALEGYTFKGWVKEGTDEAFDQAKVMDGDTYVAKLEAVQVTPDPEPELEDIAFRYHKNETEVVDFKLGKDASLQALCDWANQAGLDFSKVKGFTTAGVQDGADVEWKLDAKLADVFAHVGKSGMKLSAHDENSKVFMELHFKKEDGVLGFTIAHKDVTEPETPVEETFMAHVTLGDKYVDLKSSGGVSLASAMALLDQYGIATKDVARLAIVDGEKETELATDTTVADFVKLMTGKKLIIRGYQKDNKLLGEATMTAGKEANQFNIDIKVVELEEPSPEPEEQTYKVVYHKADDKTVEFKVPKTATWKEFRDAIAKEITGFDKITGFVAAGVQDGKDVKLGLDEKVANIFDKVGETGVKIAAHDEKGTVLAELHFKNEEGGLGFTVAFKDAKPEDGEKPGDEKPNDEKPNGEKPDGGQVDQGLTYLINLTDTKGNTSTVKGVKSIHTWGDFAKQIADAKLMDWSDVAKWTLKQAKASERAIGADTKMKEIVDLLKDGDVQVTAYDKDGKALGCAVLTANGKENSFDVLLSKDTNVTLRTAEEISNKGKGEGVSQEGKGDGVAPSVQTADSNALLIYSVAAGTLVLAIGGYVVYQRKVKPE